MKEARPKDWIQREIADARRLNDSLPYWLKPPRREAGGRMTPEEQAPVRRMLRAFDYWNANRGKDDERDEEMFRALLATLAPLRATAVPAPEETVEMTEERAFNFGLYDCEGCGASNLSSSAAYPGQHWLYDEDAGANTLCGPLVVHAPESAGEADQLDGKGTQERCATWQDWKELVDRNMAISAEWEARAEDAERKLEEMREALTTANEALRQNITTWLTLAPLLEEPYPDDPRWTPWTRFGKRAADAAVNAQAVIRRALTPPASTAAHEHGLTQRWCDQCGDLPCCEPGDDCGYEDCPRRASTAQGDEDGPAR